MIKFLVKSGDGSREVEVNGESVTIGRSGDNFLKLEDKKSSRKHARIEKIDGEYRVVDLESGNGTKVNGKDINFHVLAKGDEIQIGLSTLTVLTVDGPVKAAVAPAPVAVAAAAPAAPAAKPEAPETKRPAVSHRSHYRRSSSSSGTLVALVAVVIIGAAIAFAATKFGGAGGNLGSVGRGSGIDRAPRTGPTAQQAADAYADFQGRASRDAVSDGLIGEAETLAEKFGELEPRFATLASELRQKRSDSMRSMAFGQVEPLVQAALKEQRYGDAIDALKALKGGPDAEQAGKLLVQIEDKVKEVWKDVDGSGRKLQEQKQYAAAADHYRKEAPKFRGTQYYKTIANKPEFLEQLAEAELAAARAREQKPAEAPMIAKAEPKPEPPKPAPEMKPEMPKPPAMEPPKPAMPKPEMPKPAMPKPPEPKPEPKPAPKPEMPKEEPKKEEPKPEPAKLSIKKPDVLCDCKKIAKGNYCAKCERVLGPDDIRGGNCKKCDEKPKKIDLCVKRYFMPDGHPEKMSPNPVIFEGKVWDMPHEDTAKIAYLCESCGEAGDLSSEIKHTAECKSKFNTVKICAKSGTAPHVPKK
jgi:hypothetical protein